MRLLFLTLLLVVSSVYSRPSTRDDGKGVRTISRKARHSPQTKDSKSKCSSSSTDDIMENSNESMDTDRWEEMMREECGIGFGEDMNVPVSSAEMGFALSGMSELVDEVANGLLMQMMAVEAHWQGQNVQDFASVRGELTELRSIIDDAFEKGMCHFARLEMMFDRMTHAGGEGFGKLPCQQAYGMVAGFIDVPDVMDRYNIITADWLHEFGAAIRNDMRCIITDTGDVGKEILSLTGLADNTPSWSLRTVQTKLAIIMAYDSILENELEHFEIAIGVVGDALNHIDLDKLPAPVYRNQYRNLQNIVKRLLRSKN